MSNLTSDDIKELAIKAARWDYAIQRGFWYADNPNVDAYHSCGINFRLWSDPIDREGLEAAVRQRSDPPRPYASSQSGCYRKRGGP